MSYRRQAAAWEEGVATETITNEWEYCRDCGVEFEKTTLDAMPKTKVLSFDKQNKKGAKEDDTNMKKK